MKAVIYARYSSDNQREESIEGQLRECTAFAEKNGYTIVSHYIDRAYSAKTDNRPEFQHMIQDSAKHMFDYVIVWKLDRFSRNRYDSARYKNQLKKNGVRVISATESISEGAEGIILESVLEGYAEYYSADLSEKVIRGMTENILKSKFNGGSIPMGYMIDDKQQFQPDPIVAPYVLEAFKQYAEGKTMKQICHYLNARGVKNTLGDAISVDIIHHMLRNRRYIGENRFREVVMADAIPAIIPKDLFERVQKKLALNHTAPARHKTEDEYILSTKLFCGHCGAHMCGESGASRNGTIYRYYKCMSVKKRKLDCHKKNVRKAWIEDYVINETMRIVMDDNMVDALVAKLMVMQGEENKELLLYEHQLDEVNGSINNVLTAIQQGILTRSTKEKLEELEVERETLESKIAQEKLAHPKISEEFIRFWIGRFRELDVTDKAHRKMLVDTFVNAVYLYDDKMLITYNFDDLADPVSFDMVKKAEEMGSSDYPRCGVGTPSEKEPPLDNPNLGRTKGFQGVGIGSSDLNVSGEIHASKQQASGFFYLTQNAPGCILDSSI